MRGQHEDAVRILRKLIPETKAIAELARSHRTRVEYADSWRTLGTHLFFLGKYPEALEALDKALGLHRVLHAENREGVFVRKSIAFALRAKGHAQRQLKQRDAARSSI